MQNRVTSLMDQKKCSTLWPDVVIQKSERVTSRKINEMQISQEPLQIWKI